MKYIITCRYCNNFPSQPAMSLGAGEDNNLYLGLDCKCYLHYIAVTKAK
jgi:hypothetical protein